MAESKIRIFINNAKLASMNAPGGDVDRFVRRVNDRAFILAVTDAPRRSGHLASSVRATREGSNQFGVNYRVTAHAHYASFVHEGTSGARTGVPGSGRAMTLYAGARYVPPRYAAYKGARTYAVAGQLANPFLSRALRGAMHASGL